VRKTRRRGGRHNLGRVPLLQLTAADCVRIHDGRFIPPTVALSPNFAFRLDLTRGEVPLRSASQSVDTAQCLTSCCSTLSAVGCCSWKRSRSHGPLDGKRHRELATLLVPLRDQLVYVSAIHSRGVMAKYLAEIAWETEVWCSDAPTHLIHFNGERFLGPYGPKA
jgi:hypothetical protein